MAEVQYYTDCSPSSPKWLASSIADKPKSILWLKAHGVEEYRVMFKWLYEVEQPLRCSYMAVREFVGDQQKVLGLQWSEQLEASDELNVISAGIENRSFNKVTRVAAGWMRPEISDTITSILLGNTLREFATLALIPADRHVLNAWSEFVTAPLLLWKNRRLAHNSPNPSLRAEQVLLSYVEMVNDIGGAVVLQWTGNDIETSMGVIVIGCPTVVQGLALYLASDRRFTQDFGFYDKLLRRGYEIELD